MRKNREYKSDVFYMLMESKENALEDWLKDNDKDLFSRRQIQIPTPHFIVFYNGMQKKPEYEEMRLSDSFYHKAQEPQIEIICKVYNINPENNQKLKKKSTMLLKQSTAIWNQICLSLVLPNRQKRLYIVIRIIHSLF